MLFLRSSFGFFEQGHLMAIIKLFNVLEVGREKLILLLQLSSTKDQHKPKEQANEPGGS